METAANKVQSAATTSADALVQEEEEESDDDDDDLSSVRTTLELEYATAIDSVDTATDEFYTFKTTLESKLDTNQILNMCNSSGKSGAHSVRVLIGLCT